MPTKKRNAIINWIKKNATLVRISAFLALLIPYTAFIQGLQRDVDEVRHSREIINLEKEHAKLIRDYQHEIEDYTQKIEKLREEKMDLRQDMLELKEEFINKNSKNFSVKKVINESI